MAPGSTVIRLIPVLVFVAVAGLFALALRSGDPSKIPSVLVGRPVPPFDFPAVEGLVVEGRPVATFSRADLSNGRVSVVNFWASWCAPCIEEHRLLEELRSTSGVNIYGVNYKDNPAAARRFLGRYGNPYAAVGADASGRGAIDWGVYGTPETFVVNGRGEIVYKHVGPVTALSLRDAVAPAVAAAQRAGG